MQFDEQKDLVTVERVLGVVFLDPERPSPVSQIFCKLLWWTLSRV